ncbi:MAG: DUF131 domain-containing protein [Candidatus Bathyarchaeota archaeon]|nr:DUF131 domain-containing protein [Candidatus Bathyarchaeota archaeon]MDH5787872.1 DUF131 domain-containing protein [Candidatus Bathyarchaeota archaeon]
MDTRTLYGLGVSLVFAGVLIILVAILWFFVSSVKEGKIRGGGAVIIGPFPIIFGTDKESTKTVLLLSLTLTIVLIIAMIVFYLLFR